MAKTPVEKLNDFMEELEEKNPVKKVDVGNRESDESTVPEKNSSYTETAADKARTNKGPIGIDRDPGQL